MVTSFFYKSLLLCLIISGSPDALRVFRQDEALGRENAKADGRIARIAATGPIGVEKDGLVASSHLAAL